MESKIPVLANRTNTQTNIPTGKGKNKGKNKKKQVLKNEQQQQQPKPSIVPQNGFSDDKIVKKDEVKKPKKKPGGANKAKNVDLVYSKPSSPSKVKNPVVESQKEQFNGQRCVGVISRKFNDWDSPIQSTFLWLVSFVYMFAFISFYYQIRGLYGNNGILPLRYFAARLSTALNKSDFHLTDLNAYSPSLVWSVTQQGPSLTTSTELIALTGSLLSFIQLLSSPFRTSPFYLLQFILYFSLVNVGQTFFYFQWDSFLLEVGVLTFFLSIRPLKLNSPLIRLTPHPSLPLWTIRWLLFKFMFSSGVVKLTSRCPIWWSLRALDMHFESTCIPTPLSWYAHQLPTNWLHLAVALCLVLEIVLPFLFFTPYRSLKIFSFVTQVLFQLAIILTGNFNFFNILTIIVCIPLLDDDMFRTETKNKPRKSWEYLINGILFGVISFYTIYYFDISTDGQTLLNGPNSKINFTYDKFNTFLVHSIVAAFWLGVVSFTLVAFNALKKCFHGSVFARTVHLVSTLTFIAISGLILALSIVPLTELDNSGTLSSRVPKSLNQMYSVANKYHLMSGYGLFRVMTGDGGRSELIIEGSDDIRAEIWKPYHFRYKPGDLYQAPRFNIPHQPRLDWQMWFAALDTYQNNPWLIHLSYRLLTGEKDVLNLLDRKRLPFENPPRYLRISRYLYHYTKDWSALSWWRQATNRHAYLPTVSKETLESAFKLNEVKLSQQIEEASTDRNPIIKSVVDAIHRTLVEQLEPLIEPHMMMILLFTLVLIFRYIRQSATVVSI